MSIVYDYKSVGAGYHKLTEGWLPREDPPCKPYWADRLRPIEQPHIVDERTVEMTTDHQIRSVVDRIKNRLKRPIDTTLTEQIFSRYLNYNCAWTEGKDYICPYTGQLMDHNALDHEMWML